MAKKGVRYLMGHRNDRMTQWEYKRDISRGLNLKFENYPMMIRKINRYLHGDTRNNLYMNWQVLRIRLYDLYGTPFNVIFTGFIESQSI